jgi:predicted ATPase/DNA-binding CsgD family transcriptional regulator
MMEQPTHRLQAEPQPPSTPLPVTLTSFVGRRQEQDEIKQLLYSARLVTITGSAGCGKTRLAQRVAGDLGERFADGVYWIELASVEDPLLLPQALAGALDIPQQPESSPQHDLLDALREKQALLVLDNCEHLLSACADLVQMLMTTTHINVLATSREALSLMGERRYPLMPLPLPDADLPLSDLENNESVRLFVERAQMVLPQFRLTYDNANTIANICHRLDGIPLAIELASARLNVLTVQQIATRLDDRFTLLAPAAHVTHNQHRTLQAAIDWSYTLLSSPEQMLLRRLSVFVGGFSLEAAEVVSSGSGLDRHQVLELIASLVNKSLLVADTLHASQARYRLLEMVRAYAQQQLDLAGEREITQNQYLRWVVDLSEEIAPRLRGPEQQVWLAVLEQEQDNVRAALAWALEHDQLASGLRMATSMYQFWVTRGSWLEGMTWFDRFFKRLPDDNILLAIRVTALTHGAWLAMFSFDGVTATRWSEAAVRLCEEAGDEGETLMCLALAGAGGAARAVGDIQTAFQMSQRAYDLCRGKGELLVEGMQLYTMAFTSILLGEHQRAHPLLELALQFAHQNEDRWRIGITLAVIGDLARHEERFADAIAPYTDSLEQFRSVGSLGELPNIERGLAYTWLRLGNLQHAHTLFERSLKQQRELKSRMGMLRTLLGFGSLAAALNNVAAAARLHGFVLGEREWLTVLPDPGESADRIDYYHYFAQVRARLSQTDLEAELKHGRSLSLEQAIACAREATQFLPLSRVSKLPTAAMLSPREQEVTALIAQGLNNGEIAEALVLSKRTVENHIANIFSKLGLTSRAQVVRWALQHQRTEPTSSQD